MSEFTVGDRVTTGSNGLIGTVVEIIDPEYVVVEWDSEMGPQEDDVETSCIHKI
ncbi:hypothetical protein SEA_EJIMIX_230 [Mycobacterium phage Ejimix]|nr:hypothetical protein SEA_EJIMIX_230 [Mycobacterium phage Ejimix]